MLTERPRFPPSSEFSWHGRELSSTAKNTAKRFALRATRDGATGASGWLAATTTEKASPRTPATSVALRQGVAQLEFYLAEAGKAIADAEAAGGNSCPAWVRMRPSALRAFTDSFDSVIRGMHEVSAQHERLLRAPGTAEDGGDVRPFCRIPWVVFEWWLFFVMTVGNVFFYNRWVKWWILCSFARRSWTAVRIAYLRRQSDEGGAKAP